MGEAAQAIVGSGRVQVRPAPPMGNPTNSFLIVEEKAFKILRVLGIPGKPGYRIDIAAGSVPVETLKKGATKIYVGEQEKPSKKYLSVFEWAIQRLINLGIPLKSR